MDDKIMFTATTFHRRITILLLLLVGFSATARGDEKSLSALRSLDARFKSYQSYSVPFSAQTVYLDGQTGPKIDGMLTVQGGRFVLKTNGINIFYDGVTLSKHDISRNEVNMEAMPANSKNVLMNPAMLLSFDADGFSHKTLSSQGTNLVLELRPQDAELPYRVMKLTLQGGHAPQNIELTGLNADMQIKSMKFTIGTIIPNPKITTSTFRFDIKSHPGVDVVDFR